MASDHLEGVPGNKTCPHPVNGTDDTHQEPNTNTKQMLRHRLKTLEPIWSLLVPGSQRPSSGQLCISHCVEVRCPQCSLLLHIPLEQSWIFCGLHSPTPPCGSLNTSQGLHIKNSNRSSLSNPVLSHQSYTLESPTWKEKEGRDRNTLLHTVNRLMLPHIVQINYVFLSFPPTLSEMSN